jgi:hypothetical protein
MSFIRMSQEGTYVDIPEGSMCYLYGDGNSISGWSYEEFAAVVFDALDEAPIEPGSEYWTEIADGIEDELDVDNMDPDYRGGVPQPERAEIFCQFVDRRIDSTELSDELHEAMKDSFDRDEYIEQCEYCGEEFRPYLAGETHVCTDEECEKKHEADIYNVDVETIEGLNDAYREGEEAHEEYWDEHIAPNIDDDE